MADDPMWCVVMFDLPVRTKEDRRNYQIFRNLLLENGFVRTQYSIYAKFSPSGILSSRAVNLIKKSVPPQGEVRILHVTDRQWATTVRFFNSAEVDTPEEPEQLAFF